MNFKKTKQQLRQEEGFSLVEMLVSMALLSLIMMITINIMTVVGKTAQTVDYQVNVTQESSYAAERMRRVIRSADGISFGTDSVTLYIRDQTIIFLAEEIVVDSGEYVLREDSQSVMSSDIIIMKVGASDFFTPINDDSGELVGVRIVFQSFDDDDDEMIAGTIVSTQSINRSLILNR